jgi:poly-gamma-glutamate capsule biosynthesis protein CapA/YwtB (metallophosphatase superfamily)
MRRLWPAALAAASAVLLAASGPPGSPNAPDPTPTPRLFDPRRPPARELETSIADGFTLAAVGDLIMERPLSQLLPGDPRFAAVVRILRDADAAFGNFENVAIDLSRTRAYPYPGQDDVSLVADPAVARDLATLGFDLVSRANNHAMDWGVEGMRETTRLLDAAGLVHAGVGENRGDARAARYLETPRGRVALVSMASTFSEGNDATAPRGRVAGRPGLSALRVTRTVVLPPDAFAKLRDVAAALDAPGKSCEVGSDSERERRAKAEREAASGERLTFLDTEFRSGERAARRYAMNATDLDEILRAIRQGKQHSDLLVASIHAHETSLGCEEPGDFLRELAHHAIDAGAGVFVAHGEHRLMPIEIYRGRPIFYSLANFFWCDILEPIPEETFEANRDLLARAYGDPARATDQDLLSVWNAAAFDDPRVFQTVVAVCRWDKGRVAEVRLYPVDLGYGERLTASGTPRLASAELAREILTRLQRISKPFGTRIDIESGVGVIRP